MEYNMRKFRRKFQIGDIVTTTNPKYLHSEYYLKELGVSKYIFEVVDYLNGKYVVERTQLSLERYNMFAWRKETEGYKWFYDPRNIHKVPESIALEHKGKSLNSIENLEEYEGLFV